MNRKKIKDNNPIIISLLILILGIIMFFIAIDTFTYQGSISWLYKKIGMISFISWLPTTIIGIIMLIFSFNKKSKIK